MLRPKTASRTRPRLTSLITLGVFGTVLLTVFALLLLVDHFAKSYAQKEAEMRLQQISWQMRDSLNRVLEKAIGDVRLLSELPQVRAAKSPADIRHVLNNLQQSFPDYAWIGLAGPTGAVLASTQGLLEGQDVSKRPWFIKGKADLFVGDYHPALLLAELMPYSADPWRFVDVSIPVVHEDGARSVLGVHLSWSWTRQLARTLLAPMDSQYMVDILVVRPDGTVLLGPKTIEEKKIAAPSFTLSQANRTGASAERWGDGVDYLTGYAQVNHLSWSVLVRQPTDVALAELQKLEKRILLLGAALGMAFAIVAALFARRLAQPLNTLTVAIESHFSGKTAPLIPLVDTFHEAHLLSVTLAGMVEREERHLHDAKIMNEQLEATVIDRTREIAYKAGALERSLAAQQTLHASLERMALRDTLTDLPNRRALMQMLPPAMMRGRRSEQALALFFVDLDDFKSINDNYGHDEGDELLRQFAGRVVHTVRQTDTVARLAGDEFVVLLEMLADLEGAVAIADKLLDVLQRPFALKTATVSLTVSIGIAMHAPESDATVDQLLRRADQAMYRAKSKGKNRAEVAAA